ncbi:MAG: MFS transporter [Nocardioides sp.]
MLQRLGFPEVGTHRRFVCTLSLDALGTGIWMPLSVLYFLKLTSLSLVDVGLAMAVASTAVLPAVPWLGALVDRRGPTWVLQLGNAGAAVTFALYPLGHSLPAVTTLVFASSLSNAAFRSALTPYVAQMTRPGEREVWFGFLQAMRNAGYGVGGALAAFAATIGSDAAYQTVVLANAASYVVAFGLMAGGRPTDTPAPARRFARGPVVAPWLAFRDRAYRTLTMVDLCFALTQKTFTIAMPIYFVEKLVLPGWVPGTAFVLNTLMIGLGQGWVIQGVTGLPRRRVMQGAVVLTAASFALFYLADELSVRAGVVVVLVGVAVYTLGELVAGPVTAALAAEAAPPAQLGQYTAASQLTRAVSAALAPLLFTQLLQQGSWTMWGGGLCLCAVWAGLVSLLATRMPLANALIKASTTKPRAETQPEPERG